MRTRQRLLSLLTTGAIFFSTLPVNVLAVGNSDPEGLCEHHPVHTAECSYTEDAEGSPCTFACEICNPADSGKERTAKLENTELEETKPEETEPEETKPENTDPEETGLCGHHREHTGDCGFAPASEEDEGSPCGYHCSLCPIEEQIAALPEEVTADNAEDVRARLDEILALYQELTQEEQGQLDLSLCEKLQGELDRANTPTPAPEMASGELSTGLKWSLEEDGTLTISGEGKMPDWDLLGATLSRPWVKQKDSIAKVVLLEGVTSVGAYAFKDCTKLTEITIPEGVQSIGENALMGCTSLTQVTVPGTVKTIGQGAFFNCSSLETVTLLEGVESIGQQAFSSCEALTQVTIPKSVTDIGNSAFGSCEALTQITIPEGVENLGADAFYNCTSLAEVTFQGMTAPALDNDSVFYGTSESLQIFVPQGAEGYTAENNWPQDRIETAGPATEGSFGDGLYWKLENGLLTITGQGDMPDFGDTDTPWDYYWESIAKVEVEEGVTSIGSHAFNGYEGLTEVTLPEGLETIGTRAFDRCVNLKTINLPESLKTIENSAFSTCYSLTEITFPKDLESIGNSAFDGCLGLKTLDLPENLKTIVYGAFYGCSSLETVSLPKNLETIEEYAFADCPSLEAVNLPENLEAIGDYAFAHCPRLEAVTFAGKSAPELGGIHVFSDTSNSLQIFVPQGAEGYTGENRWPADRVTEDCVHAGKVEFTYQPIETPNTHQRICPECGYTKEEACSWGTDNLCEKCKGEKKSEVAGDLDFTNEKTPAGDLEKDGYHWDKASNTLELKDVILTGTVTLPNGNVKIITKGSSTIHELAFPRGDAKETKLTFSKEEEGNGTLTVQEEIQLGGSDKDSLTVEEGVHVVAKNGISGGSSGSGVNFLVTVNGILEANSAEFYALLCGKVVIGKKGILQVSGRGGIWASGMGGDYTGAFTIEPGGTFEADCSEFNLAVKSGTPFSDTDPKTVISLPDGYMPGDYILTKDNTDGDIITIAKEGNRVEVEWDQDYNQKLTGAANGLFALHENHTWGDKWESDETHHWKVCEYKGCQKKDPFPLERHQYDDEQDAECNICLYRRITDVRLEPSKKSLGVGTDFQLTAIVTPDDVPDKSLQWSSSDPKIATVDNSGKVTAKAVGEATITVTAQPGGHKAICEVTVKEQVKEWKVTYDANGGSGGLKTTSEEEGEPFQLPTWQECGFTPPEGKEFAGWAVGSPNAPKEEWKQAGETCSVTEDTTIYAVWKTPEIPVTGVSLERETLELKVEEKFKLTAAVTPANATYESLQWESSDPKIAAVDNSGEVTAKAGGKATITVTVQPSGHKKTCKVTISKLPNEKMPPLEVSVTDEQGSRTVTIESVDGAEYSFDGGKTYGPSHKKTGCSGVVEVAIRYKETDTQEASEATRESVDTDKKQQADFQISSVGSKTYGDAAFPLSTTGGSGTGKVTFESSDESILSISGATATIQKAGTVTITAKKAADNDYNEAVEILDLTIQQKPLTVTGIKAEDRDYNGTNEVTITGVTLEGIVEKDDVSVDISSLTGTIERADAGDYKEVTLPVMTLTGAAKNNYILTHPGAVPTEVTINKADALIPEEGDLAVANKQAHTYTFGLGTLRPKVPAGMELGSTAVTYELKDVSLGSYYSGGAKIEDQTLTVPILAVESEKAENIGTITVIIHTGNFEDMTATIQVRSVNKLIPEGAPTLSKTTLTYGQPLSDIELSGSMKDGATNVPGTFKWSNPENRPAVQDSYEAAWTFTPDDNKKYAIVTGTAAVTIVKATPSLSLSPSSAAMPDGSTVVTLTLTGLPAGGSATVTCSDETISVTPKSGNTWTAELPTGGGSYTFTASYAGDENHEDAKDECTVSVGTITPALSLSASPTSLKGGGTVTLTVSGLPSDHTGTVTVSCSDSSITVNKSGAGWKAALPNETAEYTFTANYSGDDQYASTQATCTVSVTKYTSGSNKPDGTISSDDSDSDDDSREDAECSFWQEVREKIKNAESGDTVKANARGYDKMPDFVMQALRENSGVTLVIRWDGGEDIVIPAGKAQPAESLRIYYPLSLLAKLYAETEWAAPETDDPVDPNAKNPVTGGPKDPDAANPVAGNVWEVSAPITTNLVQSQAGELQITDPRRGLAETPELAEKGIEKTIPGVFEPDIPVEAPVNADNRNSALIAVLAALAAAVAGGWMFWKKRKTL